MSYYQCNCEYCKGEFVASNDDINQYFYGKPEIANDEYAWKCPTCGHVNKGKNIDLEPCYQNGRNNIIFELSDEETQKVLEFKRNHKHSEKYINGKNPFFNQQQFTYTFTPNAIEKHIKVKCNICGEEKEI